MADAIDHAAVPLLWVDPAGVVTRTNRALLELFGSGPEQVLGRPLGELLDGSTAEALMHDVHAGRVSRDIPARLRRPDGSLAAVLIDATAYRVDGRVVHASCFVRDASAQARAEENLRRGQERFELAAEATGDLIWDWDVAGGGVSWAGGIALYFDDADHDPSSLTNQYRAWADRVHPGDLPIAEMTARAAFASGAHSWEHEYRFRRSNGSYGQVLERAVIVRDASGVPVRVVGVLRDVSQRQEAEQATLRLAAIVASASDAILGKSPEGIITSWNAAAERIFGFSAAEMVGRSVFAIVPEELHETERTLLARIRRGERVDLAETERFRKDGTRISVALSVSPIWNASGLVVGASSILRDITERRRAEEELARREARYRALVTSTVSVVWTSDPDGHFVEPQPAWERYTGQPWAEHRDLGWLDAVHAEDRGTMQASWGAARENRSLLASEVRLWHQGDHRYRHCVVRAAPVLASDESVREWIGTLTDVDEQRIAEERLRQADRLETVGRLAGGVAHEANNQMTVVLGAAAFLDRRLQHERDREDLEHIRRAAQRTAAITQQLLAFSRRQLLQAQPLDLNAVVVRLEPVLQRALGETSRVVLRLASAPGTVTADPGQLDQVLLNLTFNAKDAMPAGGTLVIETADVVLDGAYVAAKGLQSMAPGRYAVLMVADTGHGMDRETLAHVFEPFFTTKPIGQGTGLGLSTVYGIVKQSGGFIWVYSEPGRGTAVRIYLPVRATLPDETAVPPREDAEGGPEVILLAEDDEAVRGVLARSLRQYGYTVLEARDGAEAVEVATSAPTPPDLVVADVVMPRLAGQQLSTELHRRWPGLPVLFTSGYTSADSVSRGLVEEGREFLQKPIEPETLARKVRVMLRAAGQDPGREGDTS